MTHAPSAANVCPECQHQQSNPANKFCENCGTPIPPAPAVAMDDLDLGMETVRARPSSPDEFFAGDQQEQELATALSEIREDSPPKPHKASIEPGTVALTALDITGEIPKHTAKLFAGEGGDEDSTERVSLKPETTALTAMDITGEVTPLMEAPEATSPPPPASSPAPSPPAPPVPTLIGAPATPEAAPDIPSPQYAAVSATQSPWEPPGSGPISEDFFDTNRSQREQPSSDAQDEAEAEAGESSNTTFLVLLLLGGVMCLIGALLMLWQ